MLTWPSRNWWKLIICTLYIHCWQRNKHSHPYGAHGACVFVELNLVIYFCWWIRCARVIFVSSVEPHLLSSVMGSFPHGWPVLHKGPCRNGLWNIATVSKRHINACWYQCNNTGNSLLFLVDPTYTDSRAKCKLQFNSYSSTSINCVA